MPPIKLPYNFDLRDYQQHAWDAIVRRGVLRSLLIWPRRNGKDLVTLNITIAKAMQRVGLYLYIAPFYAQIRNILWEGADNEGRRFLEYIPRELIKKKYESRMSIEFINGSILRLGGSDNHDSLMGGNPVGIMFTEYSLHKPEGWHYLRPILTGNGGWASFNGCLRAGTLVHTPGGLRPIETLRAGDYVFSDANTVVEVKAPHVNGLAETMTLTTERGYTLTATPNHKVTVQQGRTAVYEWRALEDLRPGDRVVMSVPKTPTEFFTIRNDDAYFFGMYQGDGSKENNRVTISMSKPEKVETIGAWLKARYDVRVQGGRNWRVCGKALFDRIPDGTAGAKTVPDWVMTGPTEVRASFMAGWLDTDGTARRDGEVKLTTVSEVAARQAQTLMLSLGVVSTLRRAEGRSIGHLKGAKKEMGLPSWTVTAQGGYGRALLRVCRTLRLRLPEYTKRRQSALSGVSGGPHHLVVDQRVESMSYHRILESPRSTPEERAWVEAGFIVDVVKSVTCNPPEPTFDICLDAPHAYLAHGFRIHNTPRGLNHFYTMREIASRDPNEWFFQHLTRDDTGYPDAEAIEKDRKAGMPESLIQQEYYCSFLASSESTLIPLDIVAPCTSTVLTPKDYEHEPRLIGVDPAYSAKWDKAIIAKRQGRMLHPLKKFRGVDNMKLADHIAAEIKAWEPHGVLIDSGRGEGVISRLDRMGYGDLVIPVNFGGGAYNPTLYLNKRVEIWSKMRDWFLAGEQTGQRPLIPQDQDLITGLTTPLMDINERGVVTLESKKQIRLRGAYVMDEPDAVAVTFAEDIKGEPVTPGRYGALRAELDKYEDDDYDAEAGYDPFTYLGGRD